MKIICSDCGEISPQDNHECSDMVLVRKSLLNAVTITGSDAENN